MHTTSINQWQSIDSTSLTGKEYYFMAFEQGKMIKNYYYSIENPDKGYRVSFMSADSNQNKSRTVDAIRFYAGSKISINGIIAINDSKRQDVKALFGNPVLERQHPEQWNYHIAWYHLVMHDHPCKVMFIYNQNQTLLSFIICDIAANSACDPIYSLIAPDD